MKSLSQILSWYLKPVLLNVKPDSGFKVSPKLSGQRNAMRFKIFSTISLEQFIWSAVRKSISAQQACVSDADEKFYIFISMCMDQ